MVKMREARYCNLKVLLIWMVVYGHMIEPSMGENGWLMAQYRWIYLVHMPLFAFLSGLFVRDGSDCLRQIRRMLPLYLVLQGGMTLLGNGNLGTPWWYFWYLLSECQWMGLGWLWFRFGSGRGKGKILAGAVALGCMAGYIPWIGRGGSLSRTIVFFPYFWLGLMMKPDFSWKRLRGIGLTGLGICAGIMGIWGDRIPVEALYQAQPYGSESGMWIRLGSYGMGVMLGIFCLAWVPERRTPFSRAGTDTMTAYLFHGAAVTLVQKTGIGYGWYPVMTGAYMYGVYKITQWHGGMYGIQAERRNRQKWRPFKRCMKNMPGRCMDF